MNKLLRLLTTLALVTVGSADRAYAAIIYVDIVPDRVVEQGTFIPDLDNDGTRDLLFNHDLGCVGNCLSSARVSAQNGGILVAATLTDVRPLSAGVIVGPAAGPFGSGGLLAQDAYSGVPPVTFNESGLWDSGLTAFLGFRFLNATGVHYGWARLNVEETTNRMTVYDYAYESVADAPITTGAVPEPASMMMALLGLGALVGRRRALRPRG